MDLIEDIEGYESRCTYMGEVDVAKFHWLRPIRAILSEIATVRAS